MSNFNEELFICHPVSRRRVWKEFSQVTEALGNVFPGGERKTVRHKMFSLRVRAEGPRGGNKHPLPTHVSRAKCKDTEVQAKGFTASVERAILQETRVLPGGTPGWLSEKPWGMENVAQEGKWYPQLK